MIDVTNFDAAVISAVTGHMNDDHPEDSMLIARAFGAPEATSSVMVDLDTTAGVWRVVDAEGERLLRVEWPGGEITERPEIRREVVKLYKAACERLGVQARDEHAPGGGEQAAEHGGGHAHGGNPHGGHPHGVNPHGAESADETDGPVPFSKTLREGSWGDHSDSEGAKFMEDIMRGTGTKQDYIDLVVQHYFMYVALEDAAKLIEASSEFASFHPSNLVRLEKLEADLEFLVGADWRDKIEAVPATAAYAARIREVEAEGWLAGVVAHHYTRYLGDLSGGQMIARRVSKQHGFTDEGVDFYNFESLGSIPDFKNMYRESLDRLGESLDDAEKQRMLDEVRTAYAFNTAVFVDLAQQKAERADA